MEIIFNFNVFSIGQKLNQKISERQSSVRFSKLPATAVTVRFEPESPYSKPGAENFLIAHFSSPGFAKAAVALLLESWSPEIIVTVLRKAMENGRGVNLLATIGALVSLFRPSPVLKSNLADTYDLFLYHLDVLFIGGTCSWASILQHRPRNGSGTISKESSVQPQGEGAEEDLENDLGPRRRRRSPATDR